MALSRKDLETKLEGLEGKDDVINWIMSENGKSINELRAKNEELTTKLMDQEEQIKGFGDYEALKKTNEELNNKLNVFKEKEENEKYFKVLKEVGMNDEFIDSSIFSKVEKNENIDEFKKSASEFLKEKPMYGVENFKDHSTSNPNNGGDKFDWENASDEEALKHSIEQNKNN